MKRVFFLSVITLLLSSSSFCQIEKKMKAENVVKGIVYKNGKEIQGYIKKTGIEYTSDKSFPAPWQFQSGIKFIPADVFEKNEKIKNKFYDKYRPKDCDGYKYDTLLFETVKYADMSAVGMNMIPKKMFMRKIVDDKISIFFHYASPPSVVGPEGFEPYYLECAKENIVYRKGKSGKLKLVNNLNIRKELNDCPYIMEKYGKKKDQAKEINKEEGNDKIPSGFARNFLFREDFRLNVIEEYNNNCK